MRTRLNVGNDEETDYYKLLEVSKDATPGEIRKSYRRLALKYHPDKNPEDQERAERRFKLIAEAYEVLSDETKRKMYDEYGRGGTNTEDMSPPYTYKPSHYTNFQHKFSSHDPWDIFNQVFGDSSPFMRFWNHSGFSKTSNNGRPRSFHDNLFSNFEEDFDILFNSRSGSTSSECTEDSGISSSVEGDAEDTADTEGDDDDVFSCVHDRLFSRVHARNIRSNLWNSTRRHRGSWGRPTTCYNSRPHWNCLRPHYNRPSIFDLHTSSSRRRNQFQNSAHAPQNVKSTSITTKYVDGKRIVTKRVMEGGVETVTVEENGFITSQVVTSLG